MMKKKFKILMLFLVSFQVLIIAVLLILLFLLVPVKDTSLGKDSFVVEVAEINSKSGSKNVLVIRGPHLNSITNLFLKGLSCNSPNEYEITMYYIMGLPPYSTTKKPWWLFGERASTPFPLILASDRIPEGEFTKITITNSEGEKECIATITKKNGHLFIDKD